MSKLLHKIKLYRKKLLPFFLGIFVILIPITILVLKNAEPVEAAWWNDNWQYRKKLTINNTGSSDSNKKVKFDIDTQTLISNSKMQSGCGDIRFTNIGGSLLNYYLDSGSGACNTSSSDYWILVPTIVGNGDTVLYMYYGNPSAINTGEGSQFSEATFTPNSTSTASEELGPGPAAHWKFDEGTTIASNKPINNNEQQINILDQVYATYSTSYVPSGSSLGLVRWDEDKYSSATVYFEVDLREKQHTSRIPSAALYTSGGSQVSGSVLSGSQWINGNWERLRSGSLTLTDDTDYTVRIKTSVSDRAAEIKAARLIIVQSDESKITDTETQIDIGSVERQGSSSATALTDQKIYYYDSSKFSPEPTAYFESSIRAVDPTIEQQINIIDQVYATASTAYAPTDNSLGIIRWDESKYSGETVYFEVLLREQEHTSRIPSAALYTSGGSQVSGSVLSGSQWNNGNWERLRSGSLTLTDDTDYTVRIKTSVSDRSAEIKAARLIVIQTDTTKITDTRTQIEVGDNETSFTNTSYASLTDEKIYKYDQDQFSATPESSGDVEFHASLKIDDAGDTVYAQLWNTSGTPAQVAEIFHSGDTNWTLIRGTNIDGDSDWDTTNDDDYIVRVRCSDDNGGGCSGNIANAKIVLDQSAAGGITDVELVHQQINTANTDVDDTYTAQIYYNLFEPDIAYTGANLAGGVFDYFFEATLKTSAGTGYAELRGSSSISNSEVSTASTSYSRERSINITSDMPISETLDGNTTMDTRLKNSATNTTTASNSWLVIQVSSLATSDVTAYADLYNITDSTQVTNSEISTTNSTWTLVRSGEINLTTDKEYRVRTKSSTANITMHIANAKVVLDQSDSSGVYATETAQQYINAPATDSDTGYTDQNYLNQYDPDNINFLTNFNDTEIYFESTLKTSNASNAGYAILKNDSGGSTISGSEVSTTDTNYDRVRSASSIASNMPTSAQNMDTQLKNNSTDTTTASSSWLIIQNNNSIEVTAHDSTANTNDGNITGATWKHLAECKWVNCLNFDGTDDYVKVADSSTLDFAESDSFTITAWFKHVEKTSGTDVILAKYESGGSDGGYKVYMESDGDITFGIDDDNSTFPEDAASSSAATYDDNKWHHLAATKSGISSISLYIDGELISTNSSTTADNTLVNNDPLYIGIDGDGTSNPFNGSLDDVKIYPYARSAEEIKADYSGSVEAVLGLKDISSLEEGLVGYWKMDEASWTVDCSTDSVFDSSGFGNDGDACPNSTGPSGGGSGKFGRAGTFDGSDDYVNIPDSNLWDFAGKDVTVSLWMKANSTQSATYPTMLHHFQGGGTPGGWTAYLEGSDKILFSHAGTNNIEITSTNAFTDDSWHHLVITMDNKTSSANMYIDGSLDQTDTFDSLSDWDKALEIGGRTSSDYAFNGALDEIRIYNRTLSPTEVQDLYNWAPKPVAYWKMDEASWTNDCSTDSVLDSSGSGNQLDSCPNSTGPTGGAVGKYGKSGYFDGSDDYLFSSSTSYSFGNKLTISAWVYPTVTSGDNRQWIVSENDVFMSYLDSANSSLFFRINGTSWDTGYDMSLETWQHVALVYDGSNMSAYINGVYQGSNPKTGALNSLTWTSIGADYAGGSVNDWFQGKLDDIRIYNYARTPAQIIEDMNAGHPAPGSPIGSAVAHWKFDEGYGDTAYDSSPQGNNGDLAYTAETCPQSDPTDCPSWSVSGKFGNALTFDGDDDILRVEHDASLNMDDGSVTLSAYVYPSDITGTQPIVGKRYGNEWDYSLWLNEGKIRADYWDSTSTRHRIDTTNSYVSTDNWQHIAIAIDHVTDVIRYHYNGALVETISDVADITNQSVELYVGYDPQLDDAFNGRIDDVRIYNSALTPDQIKILYSQGASQVLGAASTDSSGSPSWGSDRSYCPPGDTTSSCAPVGEWKFDENTGTDANDTSGNGNTGTLSGSATWQSSGTCKYGSCLSFDTSPSKVSLADSTKVDIDSPLTVEAWIYPFSVTGSQIIVDKEPGGIGGIEDGYQFYLVDSNLQICYGDGTSEECFAAASVITANEWQHVAISFDNSTVTMYRNGIQVDQDTSQIATALSNTDILEIGEHTCSGCKYTFNGFIDHVQIYDYARSPAQIAWDYNRGKPVGHWKFDECQGTTAYDSSGNGNNGSIDAGDTSGSNDSAGTCDSGAGDEMWDNGTTGKRNASLDFDGTNDYVDITDPSGNELDFGTENFTISYWFKTSSTSRQFAVFKGGGGAPRYFSEFNSGDTNISCTLHTTSLENHMTYTGTNYKDGNWHHLACAYDRSDAQTAYLYVDGEQILTDDISGNDGETVSNNSDLHIGTHSTPGTLHFDGQIDEVKLFNYALTSKQIKTLYSDGTARFE